MIVVFVDGLAEPRNPGTGAYGFAVYKDGKKLTEGRGLAGENVTNNYAEYEALIRALKAIRQYPGDEVTVKSDSRLLVKQMEGKWRIRKGAYIEKYREAKELAMGFRSLAFEWIPREENSEADELTRIAYSEHLERKK